MWCQLTLGPRCIRLCSKPCKRFGVSMSSSPIARRSCFWADFTSSLWCFGCGSLYMLFLKSSHWGCYLRFYNFKVAVKGNIRTAVTWVNSLLELSKAGDRDLQGTLNSWNTQAPKPDKVQGQKYLTVKNLLDLPPECRNVMFAYINKNGWDSSLFYISVPT